MEIKAKSRWRNIYSDEYITVQRVYWGMVYYTKDVANITIDPLMALTHFMKPEHVFLNTYKPITY